MDNSTENRSQQQQPRHAVVHSTHSNLETFDQATRDQQLSFKQQHGADSDSSGSSSVPSSPVNGRRPSELEQINSAVQLDRDVQNSRRIADENRQKASGNTRSGSWTGNPSELPYVE
ncbi:hypothetical protein BGX31_004188 [Mortierella sp. GBA43]|nr:hypothetical protein BGX31_004188 [Mortierella sp. GBA43]